MNVFSTITSLLKQAIDQQLIDPMDEIYCRNRILSHLRLDTFNEEVFTTDHTIPDLLDALVDYAVSENITEDVLDDKEVLAAKIMDCFMPSPSELNRIFYEKYKEDPVVATDYFYKLSRSSNYIQTKRIAKNIHYKAETEYGNLDITINLSKPEKDPKAIAKAKNQPETNYPKCLLCIENEGFEGRVGHPARANHRMVRAEVAGESWMLQYSPYVYYNEHCILLSTEHRDMKIGTKTFERLLDFVGTFPHYFAGSNADIPIVGGSILSHDHYQGGRYDFAMAEAPETYSFNMRQFKDVSSHLVKWPMSVIRLRSTNKEELIQASTHVFSQWKEYNDDTVEIISHTGETPHNTVTPIARKRDGQFEIDLVLRNNRTNDEFPEGIFHPHPDVHHIKKENIGLIEVMGLAVLPPRLKDELEEIKAYLMGDQTTKVKDYHLNWVEELKDRYRQTLMKENVEQIIQDELGRKFARVLEDAGVFKQTSIGQSAFQTFVHTLDRVQ
ncbi:UDP-glucose--hexose-1-phosphate uridylyltransferase [Alkalihalophilus sp. As8PL]|uniref:Galactose-1-phosphate uridylyltransferase n=1 Tax=Alkalihalophilus sp. As8PL TaxID=3237103 RepID=A0AB39BXU9_9BACI